MEFSMSSRDKRASEHTREFVASVILNRGRRVNLEEYIEAHPDELLKGVLVTGSIGSGKTEKAKSLVKAGIEQGYGALVFDPSTDYQGLLNVIPNGVVIDSSEFYQNPLEPPPKMRFNEWIPTFIQVFAHTFGLKDPSIAILQKSVKKLNEDYKKSKVIPTLRELYHEVTEYIPRGRNEDSSHVSVMNRLENVLDSEMGRALNVRHGFSPVDYEEGLLCVQLKAIGIERVYEFVVGICVAKIFAYRAWTQKHGILPKRNVLVVIEEAHLFLREKRRGDRSGQRTYLERALVESRKLGVGFMVVDQLPHEISRYVLSSCNMWIVCKLLDAEAQNIVREALSLDYVWARTGLIELPVGGAYLRVEHTKELEAASPLTGRDEKIAYDAVGLPALVTIPEPEEKLVGSFSDTSIESSMFTNRRYREYFERNIKEDIERVREKVSQTTRIALDRFVEHIIHTPDYRSEDIDQIYGHQSTEDRENVFRRIEALDRLEVDRIKKWISIVSNEMKLEILHKLKQSSTNTDELSECFDVTKSTLNRYLNNLMKEGLVDRSKTKHESSVFSLTPKGKKILHWCRSLEKIEQIKAGNDNILIPIRDIQMLLSIVRNHLDFRNHTTIAFWKGDLESIEELQRLDYLTGYILDERIGSDKDDEVSTSDLFTTLNLGFSTEVLGILLVEARPVKFSFLKTRINLGDRHLRRVLQKMEKVGIVERFWYNRERGVRLTHSWRTAFHWLLDDDEQKLKLPVRLVHRLSVAALNFILIELLNGGDIEIGYFSMILERCAKFL